MFHNTVAYGIITTTNSFAFLRRQRGGKLNLTRLIPATRTDPTMLHLLYYFSHLCAITPPLVETHDDGRPITVVRAATDSSSAPLVPLPSAVRIPPTSSSLQPFRLDPPRRSPRFQPRDSPPIISVLPSLQKREPDDLCLDIDVRTPGVRVGGKGYRGTLHTGETVFVKLWDGWKHSSEESDRESAIYNSLRPLWGTLVPRLIAHGGWGFCHVVILEFIQVPRLATPDLLYPPLLISLSSFELMMDRAQFYGIQSSRIVLKKMLLRRLKSCISMECVMGTYELRILLLGQMSRLCLLILSGVL